ncbi:MAG: hypothetical protein U0821_14200 [Chloroflexota bacterium]
MRVALLSTVLAIVLTVGGPARAASAQERMEGWSLLGPLGSRGIRAVAVDPRWPAQRAIMASAFNELLRSYDGGQTWDSVPAATFSELELRDYQGSRILLALGGPSNKQTLQRSTDDGATWATVLELGSEHKLVLSPSFATDGRAYVVLQDQLMETRDGGQRWEQVNPFPGQRASDLAFSPNFAQDQTIFAAFVSGPFRSGLASGEAQPYNESSVGVAISTDGGTSWTPSGQGMENDGAPFRQVRTLSISPTFGTDGTIFAGAWGPQNMTNVGPGSLPFPKTGLFRSRDRGATWQFVSAAYQRATVAMSSAFASDGIAVAAFSGSGFSPASSNCRLMRTVDGGDTWTETVRPGSYEGCNEIKMVGTGASAYGLVMKGPGWLYSRDGGQSWTGIGSPIRDGGVSLLAPRLVDSGSAGPALLLGAPAGGVWAAGGDFAETAGHLACAGTTAGGFDRVYSSSIAMGARLGCALGPETPVAIHERRVATARAIWLDDGGDAWASLSDGSPDRWNAWAQKSRAKDPIGNGSEVVATGAVQRFETGTMLFLPRPDGKRTIIVLTQSSGSASGSWLEVADE